MYKILKYKDRNIVLKSYNGWVEKDLLMFEGDKDNFDELFLILKDNINSNINLNDLSYNEKIMILYTLRKISVGELFEIKAICSNCKKRFDAMISLNNILIKGNLDSEYIDALSDNLNDYVEFDVDELDTKEYDKLNEYIENNKTKINLIHDCKCPACNFINKVDISDFKLVLSTLSEDNPEIFFETLNKLVYNGKYSLGDILDSYPFERVLYIGLLLKELEEIKNKQKQK